MTTKQFLQIAPKITELGIYTNLKKGEHGQFLLGANMFGTTENHYKIIWRTYGTLSNMVVFDTAEKVNEKLQNAGITDFIENIQPLCRSCNSKKHNKLNYIHDNPELIKS